jgi:preprotein translocase subunit SecA
MTEAGHERAEALLASMQLIPEGSSLYDPSNILLLHHLNAALRAHHCYFRDQGYVVQNGEVIIVDEFTGRLMTGRRWSEGLHQAVEAKERVEIQAENQTLASITFQNYFRMYGKLGGMTGTADTEAYEFNEIYRLETVIIPPNRPNARKDANDKVYKTLNAKYNAVIEDVKECHGRGQPVLVGTTSIENSELISGLLDQHGLSHQVLNAKQHAREAEIIAQAGSVGAITIATNMAGRGTDIVLGGNVEKQTQFIEADASLEEAAQQVRIKELVDGWQALHGQVKTNGGLHIIATERHESRRIDNQLRGRSGRQGDPGSSRFYLSLEDPLMRIFQGDRVKAIMDRLKVPDGEAIEAGMVSRSIEGAQRKVEARNFDIRKQLLEYDDVSNDQRKVIYQQRNAILDNKDQADTISGLRQAAMEDLVRQYVPKESVEEQWDLATLEKVLADEWQVQVALAGLLETEQNLTDDDVLERVLKAADTAYAAKVEQVGREQFAGFERVVLLQSMDSHWREHLASLDYLRQGIHLRGYAQKNPKQEYKREAFELFSTLLDTIKNEVSKILMTVRIQSAEQLEQATEELEAKVEGAVEDVQYQHASAEGEDESDLADDGSRRVAAPLGSPNLSPSPTPAQREMVNGYPKVGRNDPCPCGSGKKYKSCHGKLD